MDFKRLKNDNANSDVPYFELPDCDYLLTSERSIHNYELYQRRYKEVRGVMPELDKINNPTCAINTKMIFMPTNLAKAQEKNTGKTALKGLGGMVDATADLFSGSIGGFLEKMTKGVLDSATSMVGHEYFDEFISEYRRRIHKYGFEYSLICTYDLNFIQDIPCGESCIKDNLGYKKDEDGTYFEGTWQKDQLLYGMICSENGGFVFVGTFDSDGNPDEGVMKDGQIKMGLFNNLGLNCMHGVCISQDYSYEDVYVEYHVSVGGFEDDRYNGNIITFMKQKNGVVSLFKDEYDYGEEIKKSKSNSSKLESKVSNLISKFIK